MNLRLLYQSSLAAALTFGVPATGLAATPAATAMPAGPTEPEAEAEPEAEPELQPPPAIAAPSCTETSGPAPDGSGRPRYRAMDEFSPHHHRRTGDRALTLETRSGRTKRRAGPRSGLRRFRGVTLGLGGRLVVGPPGYGVAGTPVIDLLAEFGARRIRFVIGPIVAPVAIGFSDFWTPTIGVRAGFLAGNERFRLGATAGGGYYAWEVMAHAIITPWRDRRGGRHGFGVDAGLWLIHPAFTLSYRVAPAAWNHVGGRRAAMKRARS